MGKPKYIPTPEIMWQHFCDYRDHVEENPRYKHELNKFGEVTPIPLKVPLTMEGFECWCFDNGHICELKNYFANTGNAYEDYRPICTRIREAIRRDQIEGGMVGQYNASITQRLNGLTEKVETKDTSDQPKNIVIKIKRNEND